MAAPKGNRFWELRSKHGRDKLFETPELLWEAACEYFLWCQNNPLVENGWGRSRRKIMKPFTITGLCIFLDINTKYFNEFKKLLPEGEKDFSEVITRIEEIIYTQKFEGAVIGVFNHNIIARDLGLIDKSELHADLTVKQITGMEVK